VRTKLGITAACVGAEATRQQNPAVPYTVDEIVAEIVAAHAAGAAIAHIHGRLPDGTPTQDVEVYRAIVEGVRSRCGVICQVSTGGAVGMPAEERIQVLDADPDMATLSMGTMNFGAEVFANPLPTIKEFLARMRARGIPPELEVFDAGMMASALHLFGKGLLGPPTHFEFVLGVPGGMPADLESLLYLQARLPQGCTFSVAGIGAAQLPLAVAAILRGGHVRVGFEDNLYYRKGELARSNAQLVERVVRIAGELDVEIASPAEARQLLGTEHNTTFSAGRIS
jgi:3-keto-5-aminohexanoate cleavage enzyme